MGLITFQLLNKSSKWIQIPICKPCWLHASNGFCKVSSNDRGNDNLQHRGGTYRHVRIHYVSGLSLHIKWKIKDPYINHHQVESSFYQLKYRESLWACCCLIFFFFFWILVDWGNMSNLERVIFIVSINRYTWWSHPQDHSFLWFISKR